MFPFFLLTNNRLTNICPITTCLQTNYYLSHHTTTFLGFATYIFSQNLKNHQKSVLNHPYSQPAINAQKKNVSQSKFRHIKIKYHYIRQLISEGWCKLVKINTKEQIADVTTKILSADVTQRFSKIILGLK